VTSTEVPSCVLWQYLGDHETAQLLGRISLLGLSAMAPAIPGNSSAFLLPVCDVSRHGSGMLQALCSRRKVAGSGPDVVNDFFFQFP
jgi:hypothetical protein